MWQINLMLLLLQQKQKLRKIMTNTQFKFHGYQVQTTTVRQLQVTSFGCLKKSTNTRWCLMGRRDLIF
jgi:hypothetical protein